MGIGPVFAVPKLLARHGLTIDDIDLWELNEAFASQLLCACARHPERATERVGRFIAIGHPFGMTGALHRTCCTRTACAKYGIVTMCVGGAWARPACSKFVGGVAHEQPAAPRCG
jgi:acetyl-CoA C-acetyltransferase